MSPLPVIGEMGMMAPAPGPRRIPCICRDEPATPPPQPAWSGCVSDSSRLSRLGLDGEPGPARCFQGGFVLTLSRAQVAGWSHPGTATSQGLDS